MADYAVADYSELVRCIRDCWSENTGEHCDCDECMYREHIIEDGDFTDYTHCETMMVLDAAKAIEDLLSEYDKLYAKHVDLLKAAKAMHTWIFLHTGDEQKAYDECHLSDEMNAALGSDRVSYWIYVDKETKE